MKQTARILLLLACCLSGPGASVRAANAQPGGVPPEGWSRFQGWEVTGFAVTGLPPGLANEGARGLQLSGQWKLLRGRVRPEFHPNVLRDDVRRLRLFLARRGYPASRVWAHFDADDRRHRLRLELRVEPGTPVLLRALRYEGWPAAVAPPDSMDVHLLNPGEPLVDAHVVETVAFLRKWLRNAGYAEASVKAALAAVGPAAVDLRILVEPGDLYTITEVEVRGCAEDLVPVARRVMDIAPGSPFSGRVLEEAATDLRITQLFGQVELLTEPVAPHEMRLTAELDDAFMRSWRASVGTWSDNPWVVRAGWGHRNLLRRGRGFGVTGTYATHEQELGAEIFQLGLLSPRARTSLGSLWRHESEDAYRSTEYRLQLIQAFRPRDRALMSLGVALSVNDVEILSPDEEELPENQDWMLEVWADRKWDWTDDVLYPTRGGYVKVSGVVAPPSPVWGNSYVQLQLDGTKYLHLASRFVAVGRGRVGWSRPLGSADDVLANRRFYAGGYNSMRGYERRALGPRDTAGNPRGGQTIALAGLELRSRLLWLFDVAAFLDSGQVWRDHRETNIDGMALAAGFDLDFRTPLGPLRGGYAWNLRDVPTGEPDALWHFGIGYPW